MTPTNPKVSDNNESHGTQKEQDHKREDHEVPKQEIPQEDDTSVAEEDDDSSEYESLIDSFRFERGLSLFLEIPKETIKYIYSDKLEKHIQLPSIVSFRDLCMEAFGEENVVEKKVSDTGRRKWDNILKEKSLAQDSSEQDDLGVEENKDVEEKENEESERTYEDITSFLDTIKSNSKQDSQNVSENVLRKRVHEMSARLSKQGLLCDPREYYFNPMTMTGASGANRSREDYYDVFDDFIDDSELVDDLGLSLDELYSRNVERRNQVVDQGEDSVTTTSIQTSELINVDYSNPNVFFCDDDPQNDLIDLYYESESDNEYGEISDENGYTDGEQDDLDMGIGGSDVSPKKKSQTLRDILNSPVIKLLIQLRTDCWVYYSPKNIQSNKEQSLEQNSEGQLNAQTSSTPMIDFPIGVPSSQATVDLTTPTAKGNKEAIPGTYYFPQRTPRVVSDWFRTLNQKIKEAIQAYNYCKGYYNENGNIKCEKGHQDPEIMNNIKILSSNIEKDPILLRVPSLFSDIYSNPADVAPFDSKLIRLIWEGLNICVPINNKKKQFNLSQNSSESSSIIQLLTRFESFRTKWARLILNHNQEALYQFDLNAFEAITNYPPIKNKSPEYVQRVLNSISEYNLQINSSGTKDKEEKSDSKADEPAEGSNTPILAIDTFNIDEISMEDIKLENLDASQIQNDTSSEHNFERSDSFTNIYLADTLEHSDSQDSPQGEVFDKNKPAKGTDSNSQGIKAVNCDLVLDFGISLLEYIHGINRLRIVYKDMISSNVMTKSVQKEQENIPANGSRGLELMIKGYILKRFSNVHFEGQKIKDIPHRFFLNQVKLLQIKYSYKSLTSISARRPKVEPECKAAKKRQRKDTGKVSLEQSPNKNASDNGTENPVKSKKPRRSNSNSSGEKQMGHVNITLDSFTREESSTFSNEELLNSNLHATAEKPKQRLRKNKKTVKIEDHSSFVLLEELTEFSQSCPLETPRLDLHDQNIQEASSGVSLIPSCNQSTLQGGVVMRELCDPGKMVSHTVQEDLSVHNS
ncbi:uncharacterized protein ELE39_001037 [Cryptosporidium sp. chipmunk genotype I]|uniref:uncharacterized protein n=1 Tax=Cryptosporidium sp. chipmunk genotype I TaxID=1280935 RepID=UPI00351A159C|nr:hypothetical protein ELE39_001037 [Cryptosporidium sp. chipmunk genotype I]